MPTTARLLPTRLWADRRRRREVLGLVATIGVALALLYHRLLLGAIIFSRDTSRLHYPLKTFVVERLRSGHLPLWFPFESLGTPCLAAGVTAVFHPLTWLAVLTSPLTAHAICPIVCIVLTALGTWLLARRVGASRAGAAAALVVAVGGGSFVSTLDNQTFLWGVTALPFALVGAFDLARRQRPQRGVVVVALALAWAVLAGDFEAAYLFGVLGLVTVLAVAKVGRTRAVLRLAVAGALGLGLSAVQLLPSLAVLHDIDRARGLAWATAARWSMHPLRLAEVFLGDLIHYVPLGRGPHAYTLVGAGERAPWQLSVFLGALVLVALVLLPFARRRRVAALFGGLGVGLLVAAMGQYGGLYWLAFHLSPFWNVFRYPEKLVPYAQILLAVTTGIVVTDAWRRPRRSAVVSASTGVVLLAAVPALASVAGSSGPVLATWLHRAESGALSAAEVAILLAVVWFACHRRHLGRIGGALSLVPLVVALVQLAPLDGRLLGMTSGPGFVLTAPSVGATTLRKVGLGGPGTARVTSYRGTTIGLQLPPGSDLAGGFAGRTLWDRAALAPDNGSLFGIESTTHYLPVVTDRYRKEIDRAPLRWIRRDAAIFNGGYVLVDRPTFLGTGMPPDTVILDRPDIGLVITRSEKVLPRAFVTTPRFVENGPAADRALASADVAAGRVAVVEEPPVTGYTGLGERGAPQAAPIVRYTPERVDVEAKLDRPGVLVLNDAWFPGWRASVDGHHVPIVRANYLVRGVLLGAGRHRVVFRYSTPAAVWAGISLSIATVLALAVGLGLVSVRRRATAARGFHQRV